MWASLFMLHGEKKSSSGFTLIEVAIVFLALGTLACIAIPRYFNYLEAARVAKACADIRVIEKEIFLYRVSKGKLPGSLQSVKRDKFPGPWGAPYVYLRIEGDEKGVGQARKDRFLVPINTDFDLYSSGKDGKSSSPVGARGSRDDVIRAFNGAYVGLASKL